MAEIADPKMKHLLDYAINKNASDIHLTQGVPPTIRVDGKLLAVADEPVLTAQITEKLIKSYMSQEQVKKFLERKEIDFSFGHKDFRFRVNTYLQKGYWASSLRLITSKIRTIVELGLPPVLEKFIMPSQGLFIITGPTGHGKSTTLAAMVDLINKTRSEHIITIEDPVEYVFAHNKSIIDQREVGGDTLSFSRALRSVLREDPNVVLVGEMRDLETIETVLTVAETGHLVFTTLHTNSASQTADRIIDVFPPHQQVQVKQQLANVLLGVVSQRLIPKTSGGRIAAVEIMTADSAVRNLIREGKTHQLPNVIQTGASEGMISLDKVLSELVNKGEITLEDALSWALDPKQFKMMVY